MGKIGLFFVMPIIVLLLVGISNAQESNIVCGDGKCDKDTKETCITCAPDCGICADDSDENYPEFLKSTKNQAAETEAAAQKFFQESASLQQAEDTPLIPTEAEGQTEAQNTQKESSLKKEETGKSNLIAIIFVITVVLLFLGWLMLFLKQKKKKSKAEKEDTTAQSIASAEISPKQADPSVANYIKNNLQKGFTKEQLKSAFINQGWNEKDIDELLKKF